MGQEYTELIKEFHTMMSAVSGWEIPQEITERFDVAWRNALELKNMVAASRALGRHAGEENEGIQMSNINHPQHYNQGYIECIDIIEMLGLNFALGSALKYLWRADVKGAPIEDLEKAVWYIQREIKRRKEARLPRQGGQ